MTEKIIEIIVSDIGAAILLFISIYLARVVLLKDIAKNINTINSEIGQIAFALRDIVELLKILNHHGKNR